MKKNQYTTPAVHIRKFPVPAILQGTGTTPGGNEGQGEKAKQSISDDGIVWEDDQE